jgi:hypothetical protein
MAILVRLDNPITTDSGQAGHGGERQRHAGKHRQTALDKGLVRSGENKRQDWQDARAAMVNTPPT